MFYTVEVEKAIKEEKKEGSKDDGGKKSWISVDLDSKHDITYCKVANSSLSRLVAHILIFRRLMKGKFDAYVL